MPAPEGEDRLREPVQAGDPVVNVNQPSSGVAYGAAVPTAAQLAVWRAQRIVYYVFGVIQAFILIRFILKVLAANPSSPFTQIIYNVSWVFVFPFNGVVPNYTAGATVFEWFSLIALVVYALISVALAKLIGLLI
ncbi:MAG TPA: hypothetical protein VMW62_12160 [Chloroflexota bacterium]|nr:hypothetical protein [Chloroflexota bacterium]